ncbi:MAG: flagellar motor protein MotB [Aureliella sp.]
MGKKKPLEPSVPSKAYLVSFGDTMTALLAFFIVLNSLAKEQTGANMHSGTGSFVKAFSKSGVPGVNSGNRSKDMIQQESQKPIYALAENMDAEGKVGPDDEEAKERVLDRDKEQFQKFLTDIESKFGIQSSERFTNQTVFDSFEPVKPPSGGISRHAIQLMSDAISKLRKPSTNIEVVIWANMPSPIDMEKQLKLSEEFRERIEGIFWLKEGDKNRIRYRVKPWLFSDAKRPVLSVILSEAQS